MHAFIREFEGNYRKSKKIICLSEENATDSFKIFLDREINYAILRENWPLLS